MATSLGHTRHRHQRCARASTFTVFGSYTALSETLDNGWGYGGVLGFDIALTKSGLAFLMAVRYSQTGTNYVVSGTTTSVDFDPLTYQLGLGWRF